MAISIGSTVHAVCREAGWNMRVSDLERLLYIAHAEHLRRHGAPLLAGEPFEARRGDITPVIPALDRARKIFGPRSVKPWFFDRDPLPDEETQAFLASAVNSLWKQEGRLDDEVRASLLGATSREDGAWAKAYPTKRESPHVDWAVIPDDLIADEARARVNGARACSPS